MAVGGEVVDINKVIISATGTQKDLARQFLGESVLDNEYLSSKRIEIFEKMVEVSKGYNLVVKTHCSHVAVGGQPLIPYNLSQGCILIIRGQLDNVRTLLLIKDLKRLTNSTAI